MSLFHYFLLKVKQEQKKIFFKQNPNYSEEEV